MSRSRRFQSGFTLVETAIATAILAYVSVNFVGSFVNLAHSQVRSRLMLQAADYARESLEVVYNINSNTLGNPTAWNDLIYDKADGSTQYKPNFNQVWQTVSLAGGVDDINTFFQRSITFHKVCRDTGNFGELSDDPTCDIDQNVVKVISKVTVNHASSSNDIEVTSFVINPNSI
jgi:prepilin-type N-terminal cleavage/methylation domain-containing protein